MLSHAEPSRPPGSQSAVANTPVGSRGQIRDPQRFLSLQVQTACTCYGRHAKLPHSVLDRAMRFGYTEERVRHVRGDDVS